MGLLAAFPVFAADAVVTMTFKKAHFASGHDLEKFAAALGLELHAGEVQQ